MISVSPLSHICRDGNGVAWIDDTSVKVIEVVLDHLAYGWSAEARHEQHPHLQLAQIHAALAFYYDHPAEFDAEIARQAARIRETRSTTGLAPLQARLQASPSGNEPRGSTWMSMCPLRSLADYAGAG